MWHHKQLPLYYSILYPCSYDRPYLFWEAILELEQVKAVYFYLSFCLKSFKNSIYTFGGLFGVFFDDFFPNTENKTHSDLTMRVPELGGILGLDLKPLYFKPGSKAISINSKFSRSMLFLGHQFSSIITAKIIVANYFPNFMCVSF